MFIINHILNDQIKLIYVATLNNLIGVSTFKILEGIVAYKNMFLRHIDIHMNA